MIMSWRRLIVLVLAMAVFMPGVRAQGLSKPTLEKVREYGAIYVGYRESALPFSYFVANEAVGYSKELCDRIVGAVMDKLGDPALKVVRVPLPDSSRLLMLMTGVIDLECGATTNTRIAQQSVAFSVTTYVSGLKAVVRKDSGIGRIANLNGKAVVTTAGTNAERVVKTVLAGRNLSASAKNARTHAESLAMLVSGQADVFVADEVTIAGLLANSPQAAALGVLDEHFGFEPYGIVLRKDDPEFKKLVDATLIAMMTNGELNKLYFRWFTSPIPPQGVNLQIPMGNMLKELLRNPNDKGI